MNQSLIINHQPPSQHSERCWVLWFAIIVMLLTTVPYFVGYRDQGSVWSFTGFVFGVDDGNNYIAKMLRGANGDWLFRTPYSAYFQRGVLAYIFYIFLGKLASPPGQHEQLVALYHLARIGAGILMILATYDFISLFVKKIRLRRLGVILASLGGGGGWLLVILGHKNWLGSLPLEFYSPESFGFLTLYGLPHLALTRAFFLWGLVYFLNPEEAFFQTKPSFEFLIKHGAFSGFLWLIMGLLQPLIVVLAWAVVGLYTVAKVFAQNTRTSIKEWFFKHDAQRLILSVLVSSPIVIYTLIDFNADQFHRTWISQIIVPAPHPLQYLVAYGAILPVAVIGIFKNIKAKFNPVWLLILWFFAFPFLVYFPHGLQRRLAEGFWLVLVTLSALALDGLPDAILKRLRTAIILVFPSTWVLLIGGFLAASNPALPLFRPSDEITAFNYLAENASNEDVVLSAYDTGNALPAWTPVFVVIGHGPESVNISEIEPKVMAFYRADTPDQNRLDLLTEFQVDYVFWGPAERAYGDWYPATAPYLESIFRAGEFEVFEVDLP